MSLLDVKNLSVSFGGVRVLDRVSFSIGPGETLGLVGESGCGKSVSSLAVMGLLDDPGRVDEGEILFLKKNLLDVSPPEMRGIRGRDIAMIFQEPMTSLNPVYTIGDQVMEAVLCHEPVGVSEAWRRAVAGLGEVGIADPEGCMRRYPHELSGGMKQRAMIAMALMCRPKLLIADEPTTALDVTVQAQILDLLRHLQATRGMAMLFITHNLGIVAEFAHRACVMYAGRIVESAPAQALFDAPLHPYTKGLLGSLPRLAGERKKLNAIPGSVPPPTRFPSGCRFHPRCGKVSEVCRQRVPPLEAKQPGHGCACHHVPVKSDTARILCPQPISGGKP